MKQQKSRSVPCLKNHFYFSGSRHNDRRKGVLQDAKCRSAFLQTERESPFHNSICALLQPFLSVTSIEITDNPLMR